MKHQNSSKLFCKNRIINNNQKKFTNNNKNSIHIISQKESSLKDSSKIEDILNHPVLKRRLPPLDKSNQEKYNEEKFDNELKNSKNLQQQINYNIEKLKKSEIKKETEEFKDSLELEKDTYNYNFKILEKMINKKEKIENNIQTSRSSNKIYIKPKHYIYKSSVNKNGNKAKQNNLGIIKVNIAKDPKKQKQYLTNNEKDKLGEIKRIIFNNKSSQISNNTNNNNEINSIKNTKNILSIKEKPNLNNKLIFKKKNYKNFLYIKNEPKQQENHRSSINLDFDIISKRKMNTEIKTDYNDDSMTENSLKTYTMNKSMKSMKHFHQRNPRKLNRSTTNKRKNQKNNINKIHNLKRLKKEKIEILRSLKVLMKKKIELDEKDKEENMNT